MKLFVSYAGKDEKWAKWVVWELENSRQRYRCIAQFRDFAPGMSFIDRMRKAAQAEATLALFSPCYFRSHYCSQELDAALTGRTNRLLPVRLEPCDPGAYLQNRIYIDLCGKYIDDAREVLLRGVEAYVTQTLQGKNTRGLRERPVFQGPMEPVPAVPSVAAQEIDRPLRVLFLGPEVGGLSPRKQLAEMQKAVAESRDTGSIRFKGVFNVHVSTLFQEMNRESPHIFHFSGKQSGGDILMRTESGTLTTVSDLALGGMFDSLDQSPRLAIIDTCFSLRCARSVAKVVPCAMGVEGSPYEEDTVSFYKVFYQALASGRSLKHATGQAQTALKLARVPASHIPQLCCRPGVDPAAIFLVNPRTKRSH